MDYTVIREDEESKLTSLTKQGWIISLRFQNEYGKYIILQKEKAS